MGIKIRKLRGEVESIRKGSSRTEAGSCFKNPKESEEDILKSGWGVCVCVAEVVCELEVRPEERSKTCRMG